MVYGAAFTEDFYRVEHVAVFDAEGLKRIRGSKYLQSDIFRNQGKTDCRDCDSVLRDAVPGCGTEILFGKGLQDVNLRGYHLSWRTVPALLGKIFTGLERKSGGRAATVSFRHKENGWHMVGMDMRFKKGAGQYYKNKDEDPFMRALLKNYYLRESCYQCAVKKKGSLADITIEAFWEIEKMFPDRDNFMGTSLVILHTEMGAVLFDSVQTKLQRFRADCETALKNNSAYDPPVVRPMERDTFNVNLRKKPVSMVLKQYTREKWSVRARKSLASSPLGKLRRAIFHRGQRNKNGFPIWFADRIREENDS